VALAWWHPLLRQSKIKAVDAGIRRQDAVFEVAGLEQNSFSSNHFIQRKAAILRAKNSQSVIALKAITL
jgi:hypothetical protein